MTPDWPLETERLMLRPYEDSAEGDWLSAAVIAREGGEYVGGMSMQWVSEQHKTGEVGFIFGRARMGQGRMAERGRVRDAGARVALNFR